MANANSYVVQKCCDAAFCPSGMSENSQQHARVIYGWSYRPTKNQSPAGTSEAFVHFADPKTDSSPAAAIRGKARILFKAF
jgi:hypothetical protein